MTDVVVFFYTKKINYQKGMINYDVSANYG